MRQMYERQRPLTPVHPAEVVRPSATPRTPPHPQTAGPQQPHHPASQMPNRHDLSAPRPTLFDLMEQATPSMLYALRELAGAPARTNQTA